LDLGFAASRWANCGSWVSGAAGPAVHPDRPAGMGLEPAAPYQRRLREVNETVVATYLAGANTRRLRGAGAREGHWL